LAINFESDATQNDGSCLYNQTSIEATSIVNPLPISLSEQSGMIKEGNQIWIHLDSGNGEKFFIFNLDNLSIEQELNFQNISNTDWEDIAEDETHFYIGDFGNNNGNRTDLKIWKIAKSEFFDADPENIAPEEISFSYPEQTDFSNQNQNHNFDCEAMIVKEDNIYLFLKEWQSMESSIYKLPIASGDYSAELIGTLPVNGMITGADYDESHDIIMLVGYEIGLGIVPFSYMLWDFQNDDFENGNKRRLDLNWPNHQVESICYDQLGKWYIGNEYFEIGPIAFSNQLRQIDVQEFLTGVIGLYDLEPNEFVISPNPNSGTFEIHIDFQSAILFDMNGKIVKEIKEGQRKIEGLKTGVYILELKTEKLLRRGKVVIQN